MIKVQVLWTKLMLISGHPPVCPSYGEGTRTRSNNLCVVLSIYDYLDYHYFQFFSYLNWASNNIANTSHFHWSQWMYQQLFPTKKRKKFACFYIYMWSYYETQVQSQTWNCRSLSSLIRWLEPITILSSLSASMGTWFFNFIQINNISSNLENANNRLSGMH